MRKAGCVVQKHAKTRGGAREQQKRLLLLLEGDTINALVRYCRDLPPEPQDEKLLKASLGGAGVKALCKARAALRAQELRGGGVRQTACTSDDAVARHEYVVSLLVSQMIIGQIVGH